MSTNVNLRLRQIHRALDEARVSNLSRVGFRRREKGEATVFDVRDIAFDLGSDDADIANMAEILLHSIGCLKDLLKKHCKANRSNFNDRAFFDRNIDAAIIQDLWNRAKHSGLTTSWSKLSPRMVDLQRMMRLNVTSDSAELRIHIDPATGQPVLEPSGMKAEIVLFAKVIGENGGEIGNLMEIAERALAAWEVELLKAGIALPGKD